MPGPVSDSYDPVWGTAANADVVRDALKKVRDKLAANIGGPPKFILDVARQSNGVFQTYIFSERELRLLRFAIGVALEEEDI